MRQVCTYRKATETTEEGMAERAKLLALLLLPDVLYRQFGQLLAADFKFFPSPDQIVHPIIARERHELSVGQEPEFLFFLFSQGGGNVRDFIPPCVSPGTLQGVMLG